MLRFGSVVLVSGGHVRAVAIAVRVGTVLDPALVPAAELPELPVQLTTVGGRGMHDDGSIR